MVEWQWAVVTLVIGMFIGFFDAVMMGGGKRDAESVFTS